MLDNVTDGLYTRHITKEIKMISIITTILLMFDPNTNQCQIQPIQSEEYRGCFLGMVEFVVAVLVVLFVAIIRLVHRVSAKWHNIIL